MISCAPRLKKDNGPTWKSVSIHWTDSDMNRLVPVDGLPWIRTTDKAKLFNKNGPLRVVATYRTTDGVDPKTEYRHVSMIADAIEQYVLVKIVMPKEVSAKPGADWPKFRVWAFLQPPIIGRDKKRRDANGGYVVDDIPRAGWFEAVVDGKTMTAEEIDYSKGHKSPVGKKPLKVTGERDAADPRVLRFKVCARVANNESEAELKEKSQKLRKKNQDVSLVEAGSYLKVWVRNEERTWPQKPLDDDSEKIVQSMADSDSIKPGSGTDPRKFRNHTWKRSRLATHKSVAKGKEPDKNLLYVGLYPAHVIERIEKFEEKIADVDAHEMNPAYWFGTMVGWACLSMGMAAARTQLANNKRAKGGTFSEDPHITYSKKLVEFVKRAQLADLAAGYAVGGYENPKDPWAKVKGAMAHQASWFGTTKMLMDWILKYALLSDGKSQQIAATKKAIEVIQDAQPAAASPKTGKALSKEIVSWANNWKEATFSVDAKIWDAKWKKIVPAIPQPLPLPGLWWLTWYFKLSTEADLKAKFSMDFSKVDAGEFKVGLGLTGSGKGEIKIGLQGVWARLGEDAVAKEKKSSPGPEAEMLQKILELVALELSLKAELSPKLSGQISWAFLLEKPDKFDWKAAMEAGLSCPLQFDLSVFQWSYNVFNGKPMLVDKNEASLFKDMVAFGKPKPKWEVGFEWGESKYDEAAYTLANKKDRSLAAAFGMIIPVHLGYTQAVNPEKSTASLAIWADTGLELATGVVVKHNPPSTPDGRGEIMAPLKMTWSPAANTKEPGVISLHSLYAGKWDKLAKALAAVATGKRQLKPGLTIPDSKPRSLSDLSSITLLQPKAIPSGCRTMTQPRAGLLFQFNMDFYADSHIWVKLCEDDLLYDDVCGLKGTGKDNWRLYPLLGTGDLHSQRQVFIPGSDLLAFGTPETAYQFYLRLALLDDNSCEIKIDTKQLLTVPAPTLAMIRKG